MLMCCFLPDCDIKADDFNLVSYDLWSKEVQLTWKEKSALEKLIGKSPQLYIETVLEVVRYVGHDNNDLTYAWCIHNHIDP